MTDEYPDCPNCETDVFVDGAGPYYDYVCQFCGTQFHEADVVSGQ